MTSTRTDDAEAPQAPVRRRASPLTVVGVLLLVAGLSCLGWVGYQYFGTDIVANRAFDQETGGLRAQWQQREPAGPDDTKDEATSRAVPGDAIALLRIPRFGHDYEVPILEGIALTDLNRGVGHYSSTAQAGQIGNFAIAGHRITHGQPFARLLELKKGDQVIVETRDATYTYVMDTSPRDLTVKETAGWVLDAVPDTPGAEPTRALITLTTCQDLFHSPDRSVGFGHLESTQNK